MATIQDPTGAVFSVWQPKTHIGTGIAGVDVTLCWAHLDTRDRERAKTFYQGLFGWSWTPGQGKDLSDYLHIQNGEDYIGGMPPADAHNQNTPPHWPLYFQVSTAMLRPPNGKNSERPYTCRQ
jgi:predicted enzyme related to lactoylglutathione lyase